MTSVDLIIIGAGPGGYETAVKAAKAGLKTVIIEQDKVGGTCLNRGCIPTKCFCKNAELISQLKEAESLGIQELCFGGIDLQKIVSRKNKIVESLISGIDLLLKSPNIINVQGKAKFIGNKTIEVDCQDGEKQIFAAPNIIIATGSVTKILPIPGHDLPNVLTSTEMLNLTEIPKHIVIIGGGVIGMEFASIFNSFGSKVTVIEFCKEILPNFDADISKRLKASLKAKGINIINNAAVSAITDETDHYNVSYTLKGETSFVETNLVLMAVGRVANLNSLNLGDANIEINKRGIVTDNDFRTNVDGIFAVGDINGKCQLAHAASFQGQHVLNLILGKEDNIKFNIIPAAVFTSPEAATVGLTSEYCKSNNIACKTHKAFFRTNGKALAMNETDGMIKIITDEDDRILGCHMFGPHSADLIQEITVLMNENATLADLRDIIHTHPTLGEVVLNAAYS